MGFIHPMFPGFFMFFFSHPFVDPTKALFGNFRWTTGALFLLFLAPWSLCEGCEGGELTGWFLSFFGRFFWCFFFGGWRFNPVMVGGNLEMISSFQVFGGWLNDDERLKLELWEKRFAPMLTAAHFCFRLGEGKPPKHGPDLSLGYCKISVPLWVSFLLN